MDKKLKRKWVAALRSGKFRQTTGMLRDQDEIDGEAEFCCLGVLCEVAKVKYNGNNGQLPPDFSTQVCVGDVTQTKLIGMNDDKGYGFKRIATWIEKNL